MSEHRAGTAIAGPWRFSACKGTPYPSASSLAADGYREDGMRPREDVTTKEENTAMDVSASETPTVPDIQDAPFLAMNQLQWRVVVY
eukprot:scaffold38_cov415-Prasinococcus_capsulatus_cf.AAC.14